MTNTLQFESTIDFIRSLYKQPDAFIPLHEPRFWGNEEAYVTETIRSTFVSSVGKFVDRFEQMMAEITGARYTIATVNGTAALHIALQLAGVRRGDLVLTQPLTFVATSNAIAYTGADPVYLDVDRDTMGLSPDALQQWIDDHCHMEQGQCLHRESGRRISACVPMHTFGFAARIDTIAGICERYGIPLVEDAAESIYSFYKGRHTGTFGKLGVFSFNGNKVVTAGGGGAIVTDDAELARRAKHVTTTAKVPHAWEYVHDEIGYNYRMPNLNAALACAQLEQLPSFIASKRNQAAAYRDFFQQQGMNFVTELPDNTANYWLMTVLLADKAERDRFLEETNAAKVMTRPIWALMHRLPMFRHAICGDLSQSEWLEARAVNIPSSVIRNA
jgi:perosamine synthetase